MHIPSVLYFTPFSMRNLYTFEMPIAEFISNVRFLHSFTALEAFLVAAWYIFVEPFSFIYLHPFSRSGERDLNWQPKS